MQSGMKFGMYCEFQCPPGAAHADVIHDVMGLVENLDQLGYDVFCTLEHPFHEQFAINVNPLALYSALAQRTKSIRFRTLCHTLPLHNPMILAGEIAQADILTGGRLECGMGRGHAWLQPDANVRFEESQGRYDESLDILLAGWTKDRFTYRGRYYTCDNLSIVPKPLQKPYPPVFVVGTSGRQFQRAAKEGWGIAVGGPMPPELFLKPMQNYRDLCAAAGTRPRISYIKQIWLDENPERALREAREPVLNFMRYNYAPMAHVPRATPEQRQVLYDASFNFYADDPFRWLLDATFEDLLEKNVVFVGTPAQVGPKLLDFYRQAGGFDELCIISHYGGCTQAQARRTQELFARDIMPMLRAGTAARQVA